MRRAEMIEKFKRQVPQNFTKREQFNIGLIAVLAVFTAASTYVLRANLIGGFLPQEITTVQYSVAHLLLGLSPLLFIRARSFEGRVVSLYLFLGLFLNMLIFPTDLVVNGLLSLMALAGGAVYFISFQNSNYQLLLVMTPLVVELYLYSVAYLGLALRETGELRLLFAVLLLTGILIAVLQTFLKEFRKTPTGAKDIREFEDETHEKS
jgi:hypothetical protein